jgi:hypothetical protein
MLAVRLRGVADGVLKMTALPAPERQMPDDGVDFLDGEPAARTPWAGPAQDRLERRD